MLGKASASDFAALVHDPNIREMAVFFRIITAVAGYEQVTDQEADEIDLDVDLTSLGLVEQCAGPKRIGPALAQQGRGVGDGSAGIDDVIDE